jgi:hypothetical protein
MILVQISSSNVISCGLPLSFLRQWTMRTVKTGQMMDYERNSEALYLHAIFGRTSKKNSYNRAYLQPFQISGAYHQIFVAPVLECDTSVTAATIHCFLTHILFDWAFLHITVIATASYIICAMSGLIIDPPATPLSASSPTFVYENPVQPKAICTPSVPSAATRMPA